MRKASSFLPEDLAAFATSRSMAEFQATFGGSIFLLIKLADAGELEIGLSALRSAGRAQGAAAAAQPLAFHTQLADVNTAMVQGDAADASIAVLRRRLQSSPHYALTVEKRVETATYMERISVGRARNQDVVLRHASVSKFHAWFQRDERGQWRIADAGSKNGTRINQDEGSKRELTVVNPGDVIRFGSVETVLCAPDLLWKVAQWM